MDKQNKDTVANRKASHANINKAASIVKSTINGQANTTTMANCQEKYNVIKIISRINGQNNNNN